MDGESRRKRLLFLCACRGTREMDTILGAFARTHLSTFSGEQLERLEAILMNSDIDLFAWISGRKKAPPELENDVMDLLLNFKFHT